MSDFEFEGGDQPQTDEDPAAEFLAREQDDLAALEGDDDFVGAETIETQQADLGDDDFGFQEVSAEPTSAAQGDMFDPYGDNQFDMGSGFGSQDEAQPASNEPSDAYSAIKQVDTQRAEPEKIRIWRENQKERLIAKDKASEEKMQQWREVAKKELEDWYKHRAEQLEKTKKSNLAGEEAFVKERDENIAGHEWERICRHCDFNPKSSRTNKDISRMRSILLQLKQTPLPARS